MTKSNIAIEAQNLSAGYNGRALWQAASFTIKRGEFIGVLGPNGAGKSTLFSLLLGLAKPLSGDLRILSRLPKRGNPRVGYVPQRRAIDREMRLEVLEFVRLGLSGTKLGFSWPHVAQTEKNMALEALKRVDGSNLSHRSLGELSGGELQRVFLAQALISKPDLLLLDEPLANLDIRRENELVKLISQVARTEKVTVMLIAHDINPLLPVIDRLIYVVNGHLASGKIQEIVTTKGLSALYEAPVEVLKDSRGRLAVLGAEEAIHHE